MSSTRAAMLGVVFRFFSTVLQLSLIHICSEAEEDDLPEESDASVSEAPQAEKAPAQADSDLDMDIPEAPDTPEDEL